MLLPIQLMSRVKALVMRIILIGFLPVTTNLPGTKETLPAIIESEYVATIFR